MKIAGYLLILCASLGIAASAAVARFEDHSHLAHSHALLDHDLDHDDFDHFDVSEEEYEHRHTPDGPVHQHKDETGAIFSSVTLPPLSITTCFSLSLIEVAAFTDASAELDSFPICPPRRPPRA